MYDNIQYKKKKIFITHNMIFIFLRKEMNLKHLVINSTYVRYLKVKLIETESCKVHQRIHRGWREREVGIIV